MDNVAFIDWCPSTHYRHTITVATVDSPLPLPPPPPSTPCRHSAAHCCAALLSRSQTLSHFHVRCTMYDVRFQSTPYTVHRTIYVRCTMYDFNLHHTLYTVQYMYDVRCTVYDVVYTCTRRCVQGNDLNLYETRHV